MDIVSIIRFNKHGDVLLTEVDLDEIDCTVEELYDAIFPTEHELWCDANGW